MKLEPTYVLEPVPAPKTVPTRRALLLAGAAGFFGLGIGFGSGYWVGRAGPETPEAPAMDPRWTKALELALPSTPIEVLLDNQYFIIGIVHETEKAGQRQLSLWGAVQRLGVAVIGDPKLADRRVRARSLLDLLQRDYPRNMGIEDLTQGLRQAAVR